MKAGIKRDEFVEIFSKIDEFLIETPEFEDEEIKIWYWEDEYFILEKETGIIVNWYKHLGRCNTTNKLEFENEYKEFAERILKRLKKVR